MLGNKGVSALNVLIAVVVIAALAGMGFLMTQGSDRGESGTRVDQEATPTLVKSSDDATDDAEAIEWLTYSSEEHGYSFNYPAHWQVRELGEDKERSEPQVSLLNVDGERRLALYDDALMGCEEAPKGNEETTSLMIGSTAVDIAKNCNQSWGFLQLKPQKGEAMITILPGDFLDTPEEDEVRQVLESVKGLSVVR